MKKLALIGSGDFATQIFEFSQKSNQYIVVGCIDNSKDKGMVYGRLTVLGGDDDIIPLYNDGVFDCLFIAIGYSHFDLRKSLFNRYKGIIPFANIIMPDAYINPTAKLGEGVFIGPRSYIDSDVIINDNSFLRLDVVVGHNTVIKAHSYFSGVNRIAGYCVIGSRVFLGTGVLIADNISIVDDAWIGIGCVVAKDIEKAGKYISPAVRLIPVPTE